MSSATHSLVKLLETHYVDIFCDYFVVVVNSHQPTPPWPESVKMLQFPSCTWEGLFAELIYMMGEWKDEAGCLSVGSELLLVFGTLILFHVANINMMPPSWYWTSFI